MTGLFITDISIGDTQSVSWTPPVQSETEEKHGKKMKKVWVPKDQSEHGNCCIILTNLVHHGPGTMLLSNDTFQFSVVLG